MGPACLGTFSFSLVVERLSVQAHSSRTSQVHCLYRLTVAFHVLHEGLGHKLELVKNEEWGRHCRREAIATAGM